MADASSAKAIRRLPATPVKLDAGSLQYENAKAKQRDPREAWFTPCVGLKRDERND